MHIVKMPKHLVESSKRIGKIENQDGIHIVGGDPV